MFGVFMKRKQAQRRIARGSRGRNWSDDIYKPWYPKNCQQIISRSQKKTVGKKKCAQCESCKLSFIWGKMRTAARNEDCIQEGGISDSSEKLFQEVKGRRQDIQDCVTKVKQLGHQKIIVIKEIRYVKVRNLMLLYVWRDLRVWPHWNHFFDMHPSYLGPLSHVFTSRISLGLTIGSGCSLMATRWQVFPFRVPSGLNFHHPQWLQLLMTMTSFVY